MTKKKKRMIILIVFIVAIISFLVYDNLRTISLPEEYAVLTQYWWVKVQKVTEPDVYVFHPNGKVRIFNFTSDRTYRWSYKDNQITINQFDIVITYDAEIYYQGDEIYLRLDQMILKASRK